MTEDTRLGELLPQSITRYRDGRISTEETQVAVEIPLTFVVNGHEAATLMCTPSHLDAYAHGFLFTSGFISSAEDVISLDLDPVKWRMDIEIKAMPDPELLGKRVYTSGCGKGVMYTSVTELAGRRPVEDQTQVSGEKLIALMSWLQTCSDLHKTTGGVHTAAISQGGAIPDFHIDDIGRHNAVDKVIGTLLMEKRSPEGLILAGTGRISSEILHKARRMGISILVSRGAPTHQSLLLARDMGMTLVGFVRRTNFAVFTHPQRILAP